MRRGTGSTWFTVAIIAGYWFTAWLLRCRSRVLSRCWGQLQKSLQAIRADNRRCGRCNHVTCCAVGPLPAWWVVVIPRVPRGGPSVQRRGPERVGETATPDDDALVPSQVDTGGDLIVLVALVPLKATEADEIVIKGVALPVGRRH